jgi:hypothetical protein
MLISMANARIVYLALTVLLACPSSWAQEDPQSILARLHMTSSVEPDANQPMQTLLQKSVTMSLRPTFFTPPVIGGRLKDVVPDSDGLRSKGLQVSSNWLEGKLKADSEIAFADGAQPASGPQQDNNRRMMRLSLTGTEGAFRYGASYRTAGNTYVEVPNQSVREIWGEYVYGVARVRSTVGQTWNNVNGDPTQLRLMQAYNKVALTLLRPQWPELTLTYIKASLVNGLISGGTPTQRAATDTLQAAVAYTRPSWQVRLASSYITSNNQLAGTRNTTGVAELLTASYRPLNTLTIMPSLGYRADSDQWSGTHIETPSASVSINYRATHHFFFTALGGYSTTHSHDGTIDLESVNSRALLAWTFPTVSFLASAPVLAVEAGFTRTAYHSAAVADMDDVSGLVRLIVEEF